MGYSIHLGAWNSVFAVPSCVVDEHIRLAGAASLKVLLYLLRNAGNPIDAAQISSALALSEADIQDALNYWVEARLLCADGDGLRPAGKAANAPAQAEKPSRFAAEDRMASTEPKPRALSENAQLVSKTPPRPKPSEVARRMTESGEIRFLIESTQKRIGRPLTENDMGILVTGYDFLGLPADVILMVIEYCCSIDKTSFFFIERELVKWAKNEINTHEKADEYLQYLVKKKSNESNIMMAFGIHGRSLSRKEQSLIASWCGKLGFDLPMIRLAYERCIDRTGKLSFQYINSILESWHSKGIKTPVDADNENKKRSENNDFASKPSYDLDEFERFSILNTPTIHTKKD